MFGCCRVRCLRLKLELGPSPNEVSLELIDPPPGPRSALTTATLTFTQSLLLALPGNYFPDVCINLAHNRVCEARWTTNTWRQIAANEASKFPRDCCQSDLEIPTRWIIRRRAQSSAETTQADFIAFTTKSEVSPERCEHTMRIERLRQALFTAGAQDCAKRL